MKQINEQFHRMQKLAGLITEGSMHINEIMVGKQTTFNSNKELANFLNQHKKEYLHDNISIVAMYVLDAEGPYMHTFSVNGKTKYKEIDSTESEWIEDNWDNELVKGYVTSIWMDPELEFKFVVELYDDDGVSKEIVQISFFGSDNVDMSGYPWYQITPTDIDHPERNVVEFLNRKFWIDWNF